MQPKVSILLPVYNAALFLRECLDSLARQTLTDYEIVAIDDGSTDSSGSILRQRSHTEPRLRILSHDHRGLIEALNAGLEHCQGELIARMDADDIAHPRRLQLQVQALEAADAPDVVSSLVAHFPRRSLARGFHIYERWLNGLIHHADIMRERFIESPLPHPSVMLRRQDLSDVGGYREEGWPEDYDLWLRLAAAGKTFGKVPEVLYLWRHHEGRLTTNDPRYSVERFLTCKAHYLARGPLRGVPRVLVWGAGQTGRRLSKHLLRGRVQLTAFIDIDAKKVGRTLRGLPIHTPNCLPELLADAVDTVILAAVSSRGVRALIRERLQDLQLVEGKHFWCVA